jgi:hypothetical protein
MCNTCKQETRDKSSGKGRRMQEECERLKYKILHEGK